MDGFLQATALVLLAVILVLTVRRHSAEMAVLLSLCACCMTALVMAGYLRPLLSFLQRLQAIADAQGEMVGILCKVVGICLISQIAEGICADSGNAALGKMLQMLSAVVILCLSVPMLSKLMDLVESILGSL